MIKAYAKSDVGKVRDMNQDAYYISDSLDEIQLFMLACFFVDDVLPVLV